jgi:hypothetical protein
VRTPEKLSVFVTIAIIIVSYQQAKSAAKKEPLHFEDDFACILPETSSDAIPDRSDEHHSVLACHVCPGLDDQTIFPDKVIENIVTAHMEAKKLLHLLRSPFACGDFDKMSHIHEFLERFIMLTDICSSAAQATKQKIEKLPTRGIDNWIQSRAPVGGADASVAAARAARENRVALEETRQLCETMGCHLPHPLPARQSDASKTGKWYQSLRSIEMSLRECNRACLDTGIGVDDAGLAVREAFFVEAFFLNCGLRYEFCSFCSFAPVEPS